MSFWESITAGAKNAVAFAKESAASLKEKAIAESPEVIVERYARLEAQMKLQSDKKLPPLSTASYVSKVDYFGPSDAAEAKGLPPKPPVENELQYGSFNPAGDNVWSNTPGNLFNVRIGPDYRVTNAKYPSLDPLYETVKMLVFKTECKAGFITSRIDLPVVSDELRRSHSTGDCKRMPLFIITTVQVPLSGCDGESEDENQKEFAGEDPDGKTLNIVSVMRLKVEVAKRGADGSGEMKFGGVASNKNAIDLMGDFFHQNDLTVEGNEFKKRFKFIVMLRNHEEEVVVESIGGAASNVLKLYNAKPVLGRPQCSYHTFEACPSGSDETVSVLESVMDVHRFSRGDEEQPEQVGGSYRLLRIDLKSLPTESVARLPANWTSSSR